MYSNKTNKYIQSYSAASNGKPIKVWTWERGCKAVCIMYTTNFMKLGNGTCALITTCMLAHADLLYCYHNFSQCSEQLWPSAFGQT